MGVRLDLRPSRPRGRRLLPDERYKHRVHFLFHAEVQVLMSFSDTTSRTTVAPGRGLSKQPQFFTSAIRYLQTSLNDRRRAITNQIVKQLLLEQPLRDPIDYLTSSLQQAAPEAMNPAPAPDLCPDLVPAFFKQQMRRMCSYRDPQVRESQDLEL
ncbi:uncharacterized protein RHO17_014818 [Thomomys bottae]